MDLDKFEQFRRKFDPSYANKQSGSKAPKINWPSNANSQNIFGNKMGNNDDDDLYS
jgi:hypothetical protein